MGKAKRPLSKKNDGSSSKTVSKARANSPAPLGVVRGMTAKQVRARDVLEAKLRREGPQSVAELLIGLRKRSKEPTKSLAFAHYAIERAIDHSLRGSLADPVVRFDIAYHTAEIMADAAQYLVSIDAALRGRRLPLKTLLGLADNAVWHWPTYHLPELEKLFGRQPKDWRK